MAFYYELEFNPTPPLVARFGTYQDATGVRCAQTYCIKSPEKITAVAQLKNLLLDPSNGFITEENSQDDLITYLSPATAKEVCGFTEIDASTYENMTGLRS